MTVTTAAHKANRMEEEQKEPLAAVPREVGEDEYEAGLIKMEPEVVSGCCGSSYAAVPPHPAFLHPPGEPSAVRRVAVILNPFGGNGRGKRCWKKAEPRLAEAGVEVALHQTERAGHATEIARGLDTEGVDAIVSVGGDGTLHEVIQGLMARDDSAALPPLCILPGGTGNSVALTMGLIEPDAAVDALLRGAPQAMDLALVRHGQPGEEKELYACNIVGAFMAADANERAEKLRCCGMLRYDVAAVCEMCANPPHEAVVTYDEQEVSDKWAMVMVQMNQHSGVGLRFAPLAKMDDGLLDVVALPRRGRAKLAKIFDQLKKGAVHVYNPDAEYRRVRRLHIRSLEDGEELINVDGENIATTPCEVTVVPGALRVFA